MNFSLFNKKIEYSFTWGGPLKVLGTGKVCERDLDVKYDQGKGRRWTDEYTGVEFDKGITEVEAGFLEGFPNLKYVVIPYTLRSIEVTPKLKAMLQQKNVLVRGWYDSYGERFARENGLAFRHADIVVGWTKDEEHDTSTRLEIRFNEKGKPYRFYDDVCTGWAASNSGGGTYERGRNAGEFCRVVRAIPGCHPEERRSQILSGNRQQALPAKQTIVLQNFKRVSKASA